MKLDLTNSPMLGVRTHTRFFKDLNDGREVRVRGITMNRGVWQMNCLRIDLILWFRLGIRPHEGWSTKIAKRYFGISGDLMSELEALISEVNELMGTT